MVGRFLSPDSYVQAPDFTQSFNRYSYCWNNPLKYTDPDGEWILPVVGFIIGAYIGGVATNRGELNPGHWDYKDSNTWLGMGFGGIFGAAGGYWVANPSAFTLVASVSTPFAQVGVGITGVSAATGLGTDWKYDFRWTTIAGGEGIIDPTKPVTPGDIIAGSNTTPNYYTGGYVDTSPEYDPTMAYSLGGVWLPEITVKWNGVYGSGSVRGGSPYWWGYTNQMANPLTQARMMNQGVEVMYATLATPLAIIGAGELVGFFSYYRSYTILRFGGKNRLDFSNDKWLMHYHRRGVGPGQGIGRHRPWQYKPAVEKWWQLWKRF